MKALQFKPHFGDITLQSVWSCTDQIYVKQTGVKGILMLISDVTLKTDVCQDRIIWRCKRGVSWSSELTAQGHIHVIYSKHWKKMGHWGGGITPLFLGLNVKTAPFK